MKVYRVLYWVGQKVNFRFSLSCYGKTRANFLSNPEFSLETASSWKKKSSDLVADMVVLVLPLHSQQFYFDVIWEKAVFLISK